MGSGLGVLVLVISGVGQGKESSEELSELSGRAWSVVYGVCTAWSDRLVGIRVWVLRFQTIYFAYHTQIIIGTAPFLYLNPLIRR